jgi:hypothetical protein
VIKRRKLIETDDTESLNINIKYDDKDIEAFISVHLYTYGKGILYKRQYGMTLNVFAKMRLLHKDPRWRNDKYYVFIYMILLHNHV